MTDKEAGNEPAFPCQADLHGKQHKGFSKREEYAKSALQAMGDTQGLNPSYVAERAFKIADAMIAESNKSKQ